MALIIPKKSISVESNWQKELATSFNDPQKLLEYLDIPVEKQIENIKARSLFPMRVPRHFARLMSKGDPQDPLFKQVFPLYEEFLEDPRYTVDPLQEQETPQQGILHKYQTRALLMVRGGCAVNCRYCFRRHFPYQQNSLNKQGWLEALDYIAQDSKLNEIIYSGGDPLMAKDDFLAWLTNQIEQIPHITRLRLHTRLPVVIPNRIDSQLTSWISQSRLKVIMVLHVNHANEIDSNLIAKLNLLREKQVTLLNQSVLLAGVNDTAESQIGLSERLFEAGVMPYYLHMLDKVKGASHFDVSENQAREIMAEMIKRLPGFLVPKLVREIGGQPGKTPLDLHLHP
ncbi:EF-P beta-lysylation protein EpmB [Aliiglaciecola sp. 2_MG-2023]|uniref:EF-P beta-lysylation protein EpmB n=1 Tax=unclassified Aliiglaciecola TaxID=2593648 RepID=UPI0026E14473|nr:MULTISPECIES: EF-P beta-lysylation protein EpmB [unclassified Aliiglaciecola]MDO6709479.1 EF-P beta-lysylation protein EpmB [Aliiglaciecola sp. 2_MG-2023]MDO6750979.1 EF-P beta-lysylation protein EpmB [Aliiglaciecola sp. 1_MG-2023]